MKQIGLEFTDYMKLCVIALSSFFITKAKEEKKNLPITHDARKLTNCPKVFH